MAQHWFYNINPFQKQNVSIFTFAYKSVADLIINFKRWPYRLYVPMFTDCCAWDQIGHSRVVTILHCGKRSCEQLHLKKKTLAFTMGTLSVSIGNNWTLMLLFCNYYPFNMQSELKYANGRSKCYFSIFTDILILTAKVLQNDMHYSVRSFLDSLWCDVMLWVPGAFKHQTWSRMYTVLHGIFERAAELLQALM